jgi:hypothetical protein
MDFKFQEQQRVRLRYDRAELYRRAFGGSEGIVVDRKKDEVGFPMILVKWDKDHWTYNGEEDMWTFEDHFDAVEEITLPEKNDHDADLQLRDALINFLTDWGKDTPGPVSEDAAEDDSEDGEHSYGEVVQAAFDSVLDGEAFMVVSVKRSQDPATKNADHFMLVPEVFSFYKTEESGILLETQLSQVAAVTHQDLAGLVLTQIMRERRDDGEE